MPYISQVAAGTLDKLKIFGNDYDTIDGTGVRDYIHVMDLAEGHVAALDFIKQETAKFSIVNLGTGSGCSVLDLVRVYEEVSEKKVPYEQVPRRAGDIDACYADSDKAKLCLGWFARRNLRQMCKDSWHWQNQNKAIEK